MNPTDRISGARPVKRHYPTDAARTADLLVHVIGLTLAFTGGGIILGFAIKTGNPGLIAAIAIYALGMIAMLSLSTAYNFAPREKRARRNKYDHAGIFLMIGASYTPFTTQSLTGAWSWSMTAIIWGLVALCVTGKLMEIKLPRKVWITAYIALGWMAVIALLPLIKSVHWVSLMLLLLGGMVYTFGVIFHVNRRSLNHAKAVWHGHVVAAAGLHWAAIFLGVVLFPA
ncbi:MAG: hemolysin III family protein [Hellea sp.]|nr:hemolysin III family protein [Hellea sp.]